MDSNKYIDWSVQPIDTLIEREFNKETRLFYLCKTWGFVKYFHPNVRNGKVDWDNILFKYISDIEECNSQFEFSKYIESILNDAGGFEVFNLNNISEQKRNNNIKYWFYDSTFFSKRICEELSLLLQLKPDDKECHYAKQRKSGALIFNEKQILKDTLTKEERLLSLFRYWNIIEYFYPYKYLLDRNWNEVLSEYIPIISASDEPIEYHKSVIRLTSEITDAHAETTSKIIDNEFLGNYIANFRVYNINDTLIVHKIRFQEINDNKIKVGDILLKLNDEDLLKKQNELKKFYNSSNEQRLKRELNAISLSSENEINKLEIIYK